MKFISRNAFLVLKVLSYILCILCVILSVVLVLMSYVLLKQPRSSILIPQYNIGFIGAVIIFGGVLSIINSTIGLYGIYENKQGAILFYGVFLPIVAFYLILTAVVCSGYNNEVRPIAAEELFRALSKRYGKNRWRNFTYEVDRMQEDLGCCGAHCFLDYQSINWNPENKIEFVPYSCCKFKVSGCNFRGIHGNKPEQRSSIYKKGCAEKVRKWISFYIQIAGKAIIALSILQLVSAIVAYLVYQTFDFYVYRYEKSDTPSKTSEIKAKRLYIQFHG